MNNPPKSTRTIEEVLNIETGDIINSDLFFSLEPYDDIIKMRSELQKAIEEIRDPLLTCFYCKQKIRIRGRNRISREEESKTETFHFAHLKDSDDCHIKTKNQLTKEEVDRIKYNGIKESALHRNLKEKIAECLSKNENQSGGISRVEVEKVVQGKVDKEWKKPDISVFFNEKRIAIELQLSTTWLNVITRRQHFYKENSMYIFWIFNNFDIENDTRKLTFDDVIYTNNQNAYVFDMEAVDRSVAENDLVLKCYYKKYHKSGNNIGETWHQSFIKLSDLHFDEVNFRVFYFDSEGEKIRLTKEVNLEISLKKNEEEKRFNEIIELEKFEEKKRQEEFNRNRMLWEAKSEKVGELNRELDLISAPMNGHINNGNKLASTLDNLKDFISNINDNSKKVIKHFSAALNFNKPFYGHDNLLEILKVKYESRIVEINKILDNKKKELDYAKTCLTAINKKEKIEISGKKYSILNIKSDFEFIKRNLKKVLLINKTKVSGLFAMDDLRYINTVIELDRIQFSNDNYFLIDFTEKENGFAQMFEIAKTQFDSIILDLNKIEDLIKIDIKVYIENQIKIIIVEIDENSKKRELLDIEIEKKINEIRAASPFSN